MANVLPNILTTPPVSPQQPQLAHTADSRSKRTNNLLTLPLQRQDQTPFVVTVVSLVMDDLYKIACEGVQHTNTLVPNVERFTITKMFAAKVEGNNSIRDCQTTQNM